MEQKLYFLSDLEQLRCYGNAVFKNDLNLPNDLQELLKSGWRIVQVSAFSYSVGHGTEACVLLLQKETAI